MAMRAIQVLLADDDVLTRESTKRVSEQIGCVIVGEAADGREAVKLSHTLHPDVILMDTDMPYMDNLEAIRYCVAPVIILITCALAEIAEQSCVSGASACLTKPVTADALQRAIAIAVAN